MSKEPIGTTRRGQVLLGALGLLLFEGFAAGLLMDRAAFEPLLKFVIGLVVARLGANARYDPSMFPEYVGAIVFFGLLWLGLMIRAFAMQPKIDARIDAYLAARGGRDNPRVATLDASDDPR